MPMIDHAIELRERKRAAVLAAIQNPAGVTNRELRDANDFPTLSVKFQLEKLGVQFRFVLDERGERRFFLA